MNRREMICALIAIAYILFLVIEGERDTRKLPKSTGPKSQFEKWERENRK